MHQIFTKNRKMHWDSANEHQRFGIRKLGIGAASVLLGTTLFLGGHTQTAHADTIPSDPDIQDNTQTGEAAADAELDSSQVQQVNTSQTSQDVVPTDPDANTASVSSPASNTQAAPAAQTAQSAPATDTNNAAEANYNSASNTQTTQAAPDYSAAQTATSTPNYSASTSASDSSASLDQTQTEAVAPQAPVNNNTNANSSYAVAQPNADLQESNSVSQDTQAANNTAINQAAQAANTTNVANAAEETHAADSDQAELNIDQVPTDPDLSVKASVNVPSNNIEVANAAGTANAAQDTQAAQDTSKQSQAPKLTKTQSLVLDAPRALEAAQVALPQTNSSLIRLSNNLKENSSNVDVSKLRVLEDNLMAMQNNPSAFLATSLATSSNVPANWDDGSVTEDTDVNYQYGDSTENGSGTDSNQSFTATDDPNAHYDTERQQVTVTRNVNFYLSTDGGKTYQQVGKTAIEHANFYEPEELDGDTGSPTGRYSWDFYNPETNLHFADESTEYNQIVKDNPTALLDHIDKIESNRAGETRTYKGSMNDINGTKTITYTTPDETINVYFKTQPINTVVRITDESAAPEDGTVSQGLPLVPDINISGQDGEYINDTSQLKKISDTLKDLEAKGYEVYSNPFANDPDVADDSVLANRVTYSQYDTSNPYSAIVIAMDHQTKTIPNYQTKTVHRTINYVYSDGSKAADPVKDDLTFTRSAEKDLVTGETTLDDWDSDTLDFSDKVSPTIQGATPDKGVVTGVTVDPDSDDIVETVTYTKTAANGTVTYIDENTGKTLKTDTLSGNVGDYITYDSTPSINNYINQGYELDNSNYAGPNKTHFASSGNNFTINLRHHMTHKDDDSDDKVTITDTVSYYYDDGSPVKDDKGGNATATRQAIFKRGYTVDDVTGDRTNDSWGNASQTMAAIDTPSLSGYTPDKASIASRTVTPSSTNQSYRVVYSKNAIPATGSVTYIDDTTGATLKTDALNGIVGKAIGYSTTDSINQYKNKGYDLVSDSYTATQDKTYKASGNNFQVHLKHHIDHQTNADSKTVKQTIKYVYSDGSQAHTPDVYTVPFTRDKTTDRVTGSETLGAWTPTSGSFSQRQAPTISGYTPDKTVIPAHNNITPNSQDIVDTVTYTKNKVPAQATITYIDDTDKKTLATDNANGNVGEKINYSTQNRIDDFKNRHYKFVSDNFTTSSKTYTDKTNNYEVHFVHETKRDPNADSKTITRTINYVYKDTGKQAHTPVVQNVKFSRDVITDLVNNNKTYGSWTPATGSFSSQASPVVAGYTANRATVGAANNIKPDSQNLTETVTYTKNTPTNNPAVADDDVTNTINYIDDNTKATLYTDHKRGTKGSNFVYSTKQFIDQYKQMGYELVSDGVPTNTTFGDKGATYEVHLKHGTVTVTPTTPGDPNKSVNPSSTGPKFPKETTKDNLVETGKQTITYTGAGNKTPAAHNDTTQFTKTKVVDTVTGQVVTDNPWGPNNHTFGTVTSPVINNYIADKKTAGGKTVTPTNLTAQDTVTYKPAGKIIPVDENGKQIPGAATPQYTTDPSDPTKAQANEPVPIVSGYTPKQSTVTPTDPLADSKVVYTQNTPDTQTKDLVFVFKLGPTANGSTSVASIKALPTMTKDGKAMNDVTIKGAITKTGDGAWTPSNTTLSNKDTIEQYLSQQGVDPNVAGYDWTRLNNLDTDSSNTIYLVYTKTQVNSGLTITVHDDTTNQDLPQYAFSSPTNASSGDQVTYDWPTKKQDLIDHGYKIVSEPTIPSVYGDTPQSITIHVEHDNAPVNNTTDKHTPGDPINPNDPDGPKWPASNNYTEDHTYTVNYQDANGKQLHDPTTQTSTWNRTVYVDKVTGDILPDKSTTWTPDKTNYDATNVPIINGYTTQTTSKNGQPVGKTLAGPKTTQSNTSDTVVYKTIGNLVPVDENGNKIPNTNPTPYTNDPSDPTKVTPNEKVPDVSGYTPKTPTVTPQDPNKDTNVVYTKNKADSGLTVVVHDDTANKDLSNYGYTSPSGVKEDDPVTYDWPTTKQNLIDHGYKIVSEPTIPSVYPHAPETITVHVVHDNAPVNNTTDKHTPGDPINPNDPNGPKWPDSKNYTESHTYTVNYQDPDGNKLHDPTTQTSTWNRTVYVDKVTGDILPDKSTTWTPDKTNYDATNVPIINGYTAQTTSKNGQPVGKTLAGPKTTQSNTSDTVIYKTIGKIVPVDPDGQVIPGAPETPYANDPDDPTKVKPDEDVPTVPGYTPDTPTVTPKDPNENTPVTYHRNRGESGLTVIVHDDTANKDLSDYGYTSPSGVKEGDSVTYDWSKTKQELLDKGYEITSDPDIPSLYPHDPLTVTVHVTHGTAPVNDTNDKHTPGTPINPNDPDGPKWPNSDEYSQDHTYTVNFKDPDGKTIKDPETQKSHWNRTLQVDKVTGEILNPQEPWKSSVDTYKDTDVPVVDGYVADTTSKDGQPVSNVLPGPKAQPQDMTDTVTYRTIGKIIPVDENGDPIKGAETPKYKNDPNDPTKVIATDVPTIDGYTPEETSVTPQDPTKDTKVTYKKNKQEMPDILPDDPAYESPDVARDPNNDLGGKPDKKKAKIPAKKAKAKAAKAAPAAKSNNNTQATPANNTASAAKSDNNAQAAPANNAKSSNKAQAAPAAKANNNTPSAKVAQAAALPNKAQAKALPQTGESHDQMVVAIGALLASLGSLGLAGIRRKKNA